VSIPDEPARYITEDVKGEKEANDIPLRSDCNSFKAINRRVACQRPPKKKIKGLGKSYQGGENTSLKGRLQLYVRG